MLKPASDMTLFCQGRAAIGLRTGIRNLTVLIFTALLVVLTSSACPMAQSMTSGKDTFELRTLQEIPAPVQRAAIDPKLHTVYLATLENLYTVEKNVAKPVTKRPAPNSQIALAPGGAVFAWLVPTEGPAPLWNISLGNFANESLATLKPEAPPFGFGAIYLGFRGKLIVTVTAIDDWRGVRGRYRFTFWDLDGRALKTVIRPGHEIGIMAADGTSFLLLGEKASSAYSSAGELLWRLEGSYRKGAIAKDGGLALLNPSSRKNINQVLVFDGSGQPVLHEIPTPVHRMVLAPDGAAVVGGDRGRYFFLDEASGKFKEGARLPFDAELFLSDMKFVDHDTLAIGVLQREGKPPGQSWPRGGLVVVTRSGKVLFKKEYPISKQISSRPALGVTFGVPTVIGFTLDSAVRIDLGR